jgi:hypothetical protein
MQTKGRNQSPSGISLTQKTSTTGYGRKAVDALSTPYFYRGKHILFIEASREEALAIIPIFIPVTNTGNSKHEFTQAMPARLTL